MYLHIGNSRNIREKDIIGIFDTDNSTVSTTTRKFLANMEKQKRVASAKEELPKSFILYRTGDGAKIVMSQISASALLGRASAN